MATGFTLGPATKVKLQHRAPEVALFSSCARRLISPIAVSLALWLGAFVRENCVRNIGSISGSSLERATHSAPGALHPSQRHQATRAEAEG